MPVVLRVKGYKFWFYEADLDEPEELREIQRIINDNLEFLLDAWTKEQSKRGNG